MPDTVEVIDLTNLNEIHPYSEFRAELARLEEENHNAVFAYDTPWGEKAARSHIHKIRGVKGNVERRRKVLKADVLELGRRIDGGAKEITARLDAMIQVHQEPLDRIAQAEAERKAKIQAAMEAIIAPRTRLSLTATAAEIAEAAKAVEAITINADTFQERMAEATKVKEDEQVTLGAMYGKQCQVEAEQSELQRLREEAAKREQEERDRRIAEEAAERARIAAEQKAQAEREAAARREAELKLQAEQAKRDAEESARRAQEESDRRVREAQEAAERKAAVERAAQEKREADKRHVAKVKREAAIALSTAVADLTKDQAEAVIEAVAACQVAHVSIRF